MLKPGDKAPDFCLPNQDNNEVCLKDFNGKWIVLYFYPKDNTSGWTKEAQDFTERLDVFNKLNAVILGISPDAPEKHKSFIEKKELKITLLSDVNKEVMKQFGVWQLKKNYGKESMGVVRTTFIIDPKGFIAEIWSNVKVRQKRKKSGETYEIFHADVVKNRLEALITV